jgi:bifunctional non-homologous end joining protein LigD
MPSASSAGRTPRPSAAGSVTTRPSCASISGRLGAVRARRLLEPVRDCALSASDLAVALSSVVPIAPVRVRQPFDHPDWVFEVKHDGFRALAYIEKGTCRLVSRRGHVHNAFGPLAAALAHELKGHTAILDGELVCVGPDGQPQFYTLMFRRA